MSFRISTLISRVVLPVSACAILVLTVGGHAAAGAVCAVLCVFGAGWYVLLSQPMTAVQKRIAVAMLGVSGLLFGQVLYHGFVPRAIIGDSAEIDSIAVLCGIFIAALIGATLRENQFVFLNRVVTGASAVALPWFLISKISLIPLSSAYALFAFVMIVSIYTWSTSPLWRFVSTWVIFCGVFISVLSSSWVLVLCSVGGLLIGGVCARVARAPFLLGVLFLVLISAFTFKAVMSDFAKTITPRFTEARLSTASSMQVVEYSFVTYPLGHFVKGYGALWDEARPTSAGRSDFWLMVPRGGFATVYTIAPILGPVLSLVVVICFFAGMWSTLRSLLREYNPQHALEVAVVSLIAVMSFFSVLASPLVLIAGVFAGSLFRRNSTDYEVGYLYNRITIVALRGAVVILSCLVIGVSMHRLVTYAYMRHVQSFSNIESREIIGTFSVLNRLFPSVPGLECEVLLRRALIVDENTTDADRVAELDELEKNMKSLSALDLQVNRALALARIQTWRAIAEGKKDFSSVLTTFGRMNTSLSADPLLFYVQARIQALAGNESEARVLFEKAQELRPQIAAEAEAVEKASALPFLARPYGL